MKRTTVDGRQVNERTKHMLDMWEFNALQNFYVVQGSYNRGGVSQSAGTHDGGGAIDLSVYGWGDLKNKRRIVKEGRRAGFAAYFRATLPGHWNEHVHAIAIGDPDLSSGARNQVSAYYAGRDALAGNGPDQDPRLRSIPVWPRRPLKRISAYAVTRQFKKKKKRKNMGVRRVQWVLNERLGTNLVCDGIAGPATKEAYKRWENKMKAPRADGIPGRASLNKLGRGRFKVGYVAYEKWMKEQKADKKQAAQNEENSPTYPKNK